MIRERMSKDREREEAFVYEEDGIKNEIMNIKENFTSSQKDSIISFWYGK